MANISAGATAWGEVIKSYYISDISKLQVNLDLWRKLALIISVIFLEAELSKAFAFGICAKPTDKLVFTNRHTPIDIPRPRCVASTSESSYKSMNPITVQDEDEIDTMESAAAEFEYRD